MTASPILSALQGTYLFGRIDHAALERLADAATPRTLEAGAILFSEGAEAECVYLLVSGRAEEAMHISGSSVPLAVAGPGEIVGEEALRESTRTYCSTVTALEELELIALPLGELLPVSPGQDAGAGLAWDGDALDRFRLVKRATAFDQLAPAAALRLAQSLKERRLEPLQTLVEAGSVPEACWILESGSLEARLNGVALASLKPGDVISEISLASGEPARADVVATSASRLLELSRDALLAALTESGELRALLSPRARVRLRPIRVGHIEAHPVASADGSEAIVLKDPVRLRYFRLSPLGSWLWNQLDGTHSLKNLVVGYMRHSGMFAIDPIARLVEGLMAAGFARSRGDVSALAAPIGNADTLPRKAAGTVARLLNWHFTIGRGDRPAALLHIIFRPLATAPGFAILSALAALGLALSLVEVAGGRISSEAVLIPQPLLLLIMTLLGIFIHEAAHGVATKAIGRSVNGVGIGWHWVTPVLFVDTTDSWLAAPRQRLAVTLAGPLINGAVAGLAAMAALPVHDPALAGMLWAFALLNTFLMLFNLCPIMQLDGYVALGDAFETATLRQDSLSSLKAWLRRPVAQAPSKIPPLHALYLAGSLLYAAALAWFAFALLIVFFG